MGSKNSVIETGVDKLVTIVRSKRKISIPDAAKQLGVGPTVVEEWADFLEEEGIISMEYKFATPYLIERKLTQEEVKHKEKEFHSKKEGFVRKAEVTLAALDKDGESFQKFKKSFEILKKELGEELQHVEAEFKELEKFEDLKNNTDKKILEEEKQFREKWKEFEAEMNREQKKYGDIVKNIDLEQERLDKERIEALSLKEKEVLMRKKVSQFQETIKKISEVVSGQEKMLSDAEERIKSLNKLGEKVKREIEKKKERGKELIKESRQHKEQILNMQDGVLHKIQKKREAISKNVDQGKTSTEKFRKFFKKKSEIEKLVKNLENEKNSIEESLIALIRKAKAYHLSTSSSALKNHTKEVEETFDKIKKKKTRFDQESKRLSSLLRE